MTTFKEGRKEMSKMIKNLSQELKIATHSKKLKKKKLKKILKSCSKLADNIEHYDVYLTGQAVGPSIFVPECELNISPLDGLIDSANGVA